MTINSSMYMKYNVHVEDQFPVFPCWHEKMSIYDVLCGCRDAIMINIVSFCTSIYAGFAVFSIIGFMASESGQEVTEIIDSGTEEVQ